MIFLTGIFVLLLVRYHPWQLKRWPLEHWINLANLVAENFSMPIVLIGGPSDHHDADYIITHSKNPNIISLCGKCSLLESSFVLSKAQCLVSVDNGISHLAASSSINQLLLLYGPTLLSKNIPLASHITVLKSDLDCQPCFHTPRFKECPSNACMIKVTPSDCFNYLASVINKS